MTNISFDNPYLLLLAPLLLAILLVPFLIAIRRDNKSKSTTASLILHILIVFCIVLAVAGTIMTTVITETQVWVVADVSYSANHNLDTVDAYIAELQTKLPKNSKIGIICFGKDYQLLSPMGGETVPSVKDATVDVSATDISSALDYTATLFPENVIKRIVLITDGKETDTDAAGKLVRSVEQLYTENIYLDAIYLDDNLGEDDNEVQLSDVSFAASTYLNHETFADILIQSAQDTNAIVTLYQNDVPYGQKAVALTKGYNIINFPLPTEAEGSYDYRAEITSTSDTSPHNNAYRFSQTVNGKLQVLLISGKTADLDRAQALYGERAEIDAYIRKSSVPCSVEDLCKYDEILLSDIDIRQLDNYEAFIDAVDTVVSVFGKSLVTMGDLNIQNKEDEGLDGLEQMLPVEFGNNEGDPKLYTLVIDSSRSMQQAGRLLTAKQAAVHLLSLLNEDDYVMIVNFWGEISIAQAPTKADNKAELEAVINHIEAYQGTVIGAALKAAGEFMEALPFSDKQIMLISDGMSYSLESDTPTDVVTDLCSRGIYTSTINPYAVEGQETMQAIAECGGGTYYYLAQESGLDELIFTDVADDVTESVIEEQTAVNVKLKNDAVLNGVATLPDIYGFVNAKAKTSATTVLTVGYRKNETSTVQVPLYAYWNYGNGRVSTLTTSMEGEWSQGWNEPAATLFFNNILTQNTPTERIDYPYTLSVEYDGTYSSLEVLPAVVTPFATADLELTLPDGSVITQSLTFDSTKYFYSFRTPNIGKYGVKITYTYGQKVYEASTVFHISYSPEYDAFTIFTPSNLHAGIRNRGTVSEGTVPTLVNNENEVATYTVSFTVPLMIAAVVMYVIDIIIRKIKLNDLKSLFRKKSKKGGAPV